MEPTAQKIIDQIAPLLRNARHVAVLTGAGISAESGLATFRDPMSGLWAQYKPQDLATPQAFRRNPRLVWEWYAWRREQVLAAQPNPAHHALVALERLVPKLTIITQNVDNLHQRAGSSRVIELHGNITRFKCFENEHPIATLPASEELPPECPECGSLLRPNVVWFGEQLPEHALSSAHAASQDCNLFFSIGTSGQVEPAASLPYQALDAGAAVVINNLDVTDRATPPLFTIHGRAGTVLPALLQQAWPQS